MHGLNLNDDEQKRIVVASGMKYIGFIRRFDEHIAFAKEEYTVHKTVVNYDINRLLIYLKSCPFIAAFMTYWFDEEGKPIDGAVYYSDGNWCWPAYLPYYLKKNPDIVLDAEFIKDVVESDYIVPRLSAAELKDHSDSFLKLLKNSSV